MTTPTHQTYSELQQVFDVLNLNLFEGLLPPCLITLQREKHTMGYFSYQRFVSADGGGVVTDEIALNPTYFSEVGLREVVQTMAHEMVHLWQYHFGDPGRGRYHNREWSEKMEAIGLMPSDTGAPGGRRTGQAMADYPIEGGRFMAVFDELATQAFRLSWHDRYVAGVAELMALSASALTGEVLFAPDQPARPKGATRVKYVCAATRDAVWGRPNLSLICGQTGEPFVQQEEPGLRQASASRFRRA